MLFSPFPVLAQPMAQHVEANAVTLGKWIAKPNRTCEAKSKPTMNHVDLNVLEFLPKKLQKSYSVRKKLAACEKTLGSLFPRFCRLVQDAVWSDSSDDLPVSPVHQRTLSKFPMDYVFDLNNSIHTDEYHPLTWEEIAALQTDPMRKDYFLRTAAWEKVSESVRDSLVANGLVLHSTEYENALCYAQTCVRR